MNISPQYNLQVFQGRSPQRLFPVRPRFASDGDSISFQQKPDLIDWKQLIQSDQLTSGNFDKAVIQATQAIFEKLANSYPNLPKCLTNAEFGVRLSKDPYCYAGSFKDELIPIQQLRIEWYRHIKVLEKRGVTFEELKADFQKAYPATVQTLSTINRFDDLFKFEDSLLRELISGTLESSFKQNPQESSRFVPFTRKIYIFEDCLKPDWYYRCQEKEVSLQECATNTLIHEMAHAIDAVIGPRLNNSKWFSENKIFQAKVLRDLQNPEQMPDFTKPNRIEGQWEHYIPEDENDEAGFKEAFAEILSVALGFEGANDAADIKRLYPEGLAWVQAQVLPKLKALNPMLFQ